MPSSVFLVVFSRVESASCFFVLVSSLFPQFVILFVRCSHFFFQTVLHLFLPSSLPSSFPLFLQLFLLPSLPKPSILFTSLLPILPSFPLSNSPQALSFPSSLLIPLLFLQPFLYPFISPPPSSPINLSSSAASLVPLFLPSLLPPSLR